MHDSITIGIPVLAILFGILFNQRGLDKLETQLNSRIDKLETRIDRVQSDLTGRLDRMQADLSQFYSILGEHNIRLNHLEKD